MAAVLDLRKTTEDGFAMMHDLIDLRFDRIDAQFDRIDARFDKTERREQHNPH